MYYTKYLCSIDGNHVKRGIEAHTVTLQALFTMYQEALFKEHPHLLVHLEKEAKEVDKACAEGSTEKIKKTHTQLLHAIESLQILEKMTKFDVEKDKRPLFRVMRQYMQMVLEMLLFIRSVRIGDWELHLMALETFTRYFFAHDRLNYACMIPVYLADMKSLQKSDASIYDEFLQGNWVVNKNPYVPFCSIGADHGLEQINRAMKVSGGLVGITLNPSDRTKFFLISPELARLAGEAQQMAGVLPNTRIHHHDLSTAILECHERNIEKLTSTLRSFTNPFAEDSEDLFNLITKAVMPDKVQDDLCRQSEIGRMMFDVFVAERIKTGKTNLWSPMKKRRLNTWKSLSELNQENK